jgi:hypothetical protein
MSSDASLASLSMKVTFFARGLEAMREYQPLDQYDIVRLPRISMGTTLRDSTVPYPEFTLNMLQKQSW